MYYSYMYPYEESYDQFGYLPRQQHQPDYPVPTSPEMDLAQPMIAPPAFTPPFPSWQTGSSGIRRCINRNTYIWLTNGDKFWFFPKFVGRNAVVGFRWRRRLGWIFDVIDLRRIQSYQCF